MHILFVSNLYPPNQVGGYEELCHEVATQFGKRGHEISVLTSAMGGKPSHWPGQVVSQALRLLTGKTIYEVFDGPQYRRETIAAQNRANLSAAIDRAKPDVIFCWNLYGLGPDFFDALAATGLPVVAMLTDNWLAAMVNGEWVGSYFRHAVYGDADEAEYLARSGPKRFLPVNVSAIFGAAFMERFYAASGLVFHSSVVVHNGVNLPPQEARRSRIPQGNRVDLLFAGRMVEIKGAHTAILALAHLVQTRPDKDWRLNLVGDARDEPYLARLRREAEEKGIVARIAFTGRVTPEELPRLFDSHDAFLFPSLYEPFSLTLIHAMAAGIPSVASAIGGNVEIVAEGQTGLLFPRANAAGMAQAVARLVDDPAMAARIGHAGAERARGFSTERMIAAMEAHLQARAGHKHG